MVAARPDVAMYAGQILTLQRENAELRSRIAAALALYADKTWMVNALSAAMAAALAEPVEPQPREHTPSTLTDEARCLACRLPWPCPDGAVARRPRRVGPRDATGRRGLGRADPQARRRAEADRRSPFRRCAPGPEGDPMSPEEAREAMIDAWVYAWWGPNVEIEPTLRASVAKKLDYATAAGFSISLASVRDHTNCETCHGGGWIPDGYGDKEHQNDTKPCPGGSPVVWSTEP